MHEISLAAEKIFSIGGLAITNTMILTVLISAFLIIFTFIFRKKFTEKKKISGVQNLVEILIEEALKLIDSITGDRKQSKRFFALSMTLFIFILFANWSGLLPGVGPIGVHQEAAEVEAVDTHAEENKEVVFSDTYQLEIVNAPEEQENAVDTHTAEAVSEDVAGEGEKEHEIFVPILRAPSSDLNTTLALAIISLISFQAFGIAAIGFFKYAGKFINFKGPIDFFIGILELIGEVAKMISLSFRLFGNVFAGEVLLLVIAFLVPLIAPLPFFALEIFVGLIQAFIFAMLTVVFLKVASIKPH